MPRKEHFNQALLFELAGPETLLQPAGFRHALAHLLIHHDALRMRFESPRRGATWCQINEGVSDVPDCFVEVDLESLPQESRNRAIEPVARRLQKSFDLARGPLVKMAYFRFGDGQAPRLLWIHHHLVIDGVSWRILLEDLETLVRQSAGGRKQELPRRTTSFQRWAEHLRRHAHAPSFEAQRDYWRRRLTLPSSPLPVDRQEHPALHVNQATVHVRLDAAPTRRILEEVPRAYRARPNEALLTALALAFARWTESPRLLVDHEGHGREDVGRTSGDEPIDLSRTVGWFTAMYPVMLDVEDLTDPDDVGRALMAVKEQLREIPEGGLGYGLLDEEELASLPRAQVAFNYLGQMDQAVAAERIFRGATESIGEANDLSQPLTHLLTVNGGVSGGCLGLTWTYSTERYDSATVERIAGDFLDLLNQLIDHCATRSCVTYTPSDFPQARLSQEELNDLAAGGPIEDVRPASPLQAGLLFHTLLAPDSGVYVEQVDMTLTGDVDVACLESAWREVTARHDVLRAAYSWRSTAPEGAMLQVVRSDVEPRWTRLDWRRLNRERPRTTAEAYLAEDRRRGFDLAEAPLARPTWIRLEDDTYRVILNLHHRTDRRLVDADPPARGLHLLRGGPPRRCRPTRTRASLPRVPRVVGEPGHRRRGTLLAPGPWPASRHRHRWPPTGRPRTAMASTPSKRLDLSRRTSEELTDFTRRHQLTLATLVQVSWALLLGRHCGERDVVFGAVTSGRSAPVAGIETMIGLFINTLPVRVRLPEHKTVSELVREVHLWQAEVRQHEHTPLVAVPKLERGAARPGALRVDLRLPELSRGRSRGRSRSGRHRRAGQRVCRADPLPSFAHGFGPAPLRPVDHLRPPPFRRLDRPADVGAPAAPLARDPGSLGSTARRALPSSARRSATRCSMNGAPRRSWEHRAESSFTVSLPSRPCSEATRWRSPGMRAP